MAAPARQVCPICPFANDHAPTWVGDEWVFICTSGPHPPFEWRPTAAPSGPRLTYRTGLGEELGVYDDLLACVDDGWLEYGVIEYRFSELSPAAYRTLVDRYGHTALGPSKYTASSFLGGALGQLWREEALQGRWTPATGYWKYNGQVGAYAPLGIPANGQVLSWASFADSAGLDAATWPPLAGS